MKNASKPPVITKAPLGYIQLEDGEKKPISPMNDMFLNYFFKDAHTWEALRQIVNIFIGAFQKYKPDAKIEQIIGDIEVETQYQHLLGAKKSDVRYQDIKVSETSAKKKVVTYVEFQNWAYTTPPVPKRAIEYFGLGIGRSKGIIANQIWLLAEDVNRVLLGKPFAHYLMTNDVVGNIHPYAPHTMYVSLPSLSLEKSQAGELATFLLGNTINITDKMVMGVVEQFRASFDIFKDDKEVAKAMTVQERFEQRGEDRGIIKSALLFLRKGMSLQEVAETLELTDDLVEHLESHIETV